jgi:hypothetical protein
MFRRMQLSLAMLSLLTISGSVMQPIGEMNDLALQSHFSSEQPVRVRFLYPEYGAKVNLAQHRVRVQRIDVRATTQPEVFVRAGLWRTR